MERSSPSSSRNALPPTQLPAKSRGLTMMRTHFRPETQTQGSSGAGIYAFMIGDLVGLSNHVRAVRFVRRPAGTYAWLVPRLGRRRLSTAVVLFWSGYRHSVLRRSSDCFSGVVTGCQLRTVFQTFQTTRKDGVPLLPMCRSSWMAFPMHLTARVIKLAAFLTLPHPASTNMVGVPPGCEFSTMSSLQCLSSQQLPFLCRVEPASLDHTASVPLLWTGMSCSRHEM